MKRKTVLISGLPYFVDHVSRMVFEPRGWQVITIPTHYSVIKRMLLQFLALLRVDVWYQIGGYRGRGRIYQIARRRQVPVIMHWVGTDVIQAVQAIKEEKQSMPAYFQYVHHWAGATWLRDELKSINVLAEFVPLPLASIKRFLQFTPPPFPEDFVVLSYVPGKRPWFYGWDYIQRLSAEFPDIQFVIVGGHFDPQSSPNVVFKGWVQDMLPVYANSTVVIRMVQHDGYGGTVQEALSLGRYAIWSYPFEGAFHARNYKELRDYIVSLYRKHRAGILSLNYKGREYMQRYMHPQKLSDHLFQKVVAVDMGGYH